MYLNMNGKMRLIDDASRQGLFKYSLLTNGWSDKASADEIAKLTCGEMAAIAYGNPITKAKLKGNYKVPKVTCERGNVNYTPNSSVSAAKAKGGRLLTSEEFLRYRDWRAGKNKPLYPGEYMAVATIGAEGKPQWTYVGKPLTS